MSNRKEEHAKIIVKHLSQLIGKTIKDIARDGGDDYTEECFGLIMNDGTIAWVMSDEEGNGSGHLHIDDTEVRK